MTRHLAAQAALSMVVLGAAAEPSSRLVRVGADGRLAYAPWSDQGDRIPDFSACGYRGGLVPIPDVPAVKALDPAPGDNRARIQQALDELAERAPDASGFRGALLLRRGRFPVEGSLYLRASGIVLRGEGDGEDGTVLVATQRQQHTLIRVEGAGRPTEVDGTRTVVVDPYVPVGSRIVRVADAAPFRPGDTVIVHRPSTAEWIAALGMDRIGMRHPQVVQWAPGSYDLRFLRIVTAVRGQELELDAPLTCALDARYGGGSVYCYTWAGRIEDVGIENLRGESEFDRGKPDPRRQGEFVDENHGWNFVSFGSVREAWARRITSRHFGYSCVSIGSSASRVTVAHSACLDPVSQITGGRRYSFAISGQLNVVRDCFARGGRHDFVMHARVPGPNVFLDCRAERAYSDSGPHHRWATGTLYDNVATDNALNVEDRQWSGTGHGWAGACMVFWNCTARSIRCQQPPTSQNFAIGCRGPIVKGGAMPDHPNGWIESNDAPVLPRSLYLQQVEDRAKATP